jgi:hypothetical protein
LLISPVAVIDAVFAGGDAAADHTDLDVGALSVVAANGAVAFGMLVDQRPAGKVEPEMALHHGGRQRGRWKPAARSLAHAQASTRAAIPKVRLIIVNLLMFHAE